MLKKSLFFPVKNLAYILKNHKETLDWHSISICFLYGFGVYNTYSSYHSGREIFDIRADMVRNNFKLEDKIRAEIKKRDI